MFICVWSQQCSFSSCFFLLLINALLVPKGVNNVLHEILFQCVLPISIPNKLDSPRVRNLFEPSQSSGGFINFNFFVGIFSGLESDFLNFLAIVSTSVDSSRWNRTISSTETSTSSSLIFSTIFLSSNSDSRIFSSSGFMPRNDRLPHFSPSHTTKLLSEMYLELKKSKVFELKNLNMVEVDPIIH